MAKCAHKEKHTLSLLPDGVFAGRLRASAKKYHMAGAILLNGSETTIEPGYFAICHAIELSLKAYLSAMGLSRSELGKLSHCLECLYEKACDYGLAVPGLNMPLLMAHLNSYTEIFRYPDFEILERIKATEIISLSDAILTAIEPTLREAFWQEFDHGEYEVDQFRHTDPN